MRTGDDYMKDSTNKKSLFLISVIDNENTLNRYYSDMILGLIKSCPEFTTDYNIKRHDSIPAENLYDSLNEAIKGSVYEGYLIILDTLDTTRGIFNPNVMFEYGAIYNLGKPFASMASAKNAPSTWPFDVKSLNTTIIPNIVTDYVIQCAEKKQPPNPQAWLLALDDQPQAEVNAFLLKLKNNYNRSLTLKQESLVYVDRIEGALTALTQSHEHLNIQIQDLVNSFSSTARFIDGEREAFLALTDAIKTAQYSLRTTRFANQSIVQKPTRAQKMFMEALYDKSKELKSQFTRIICNNHPTKWLDIFDILWLGGKGSRVYVRKNDFSIHFELVVIDNRIAFIHFYQQDNSATGRSGVEKINSTLRIEGRDTCMSFSKIFDRLHHRDFENDSPTDPSRTLLGLHPNTTPKPGAGNIGYFEIPENSTIEDRHRSQEIIRQFKHAYQNWDIADSDRVNMSVGISLIEGKPDFLNEMLSEGRLTKEQHETALDLYVKNR